MTRVLVVDPNGAAREKLKRLLKSAGYEAVAVGTVRDGLQILRREGASLVISAVRVAGDNGLQLVAMGPRPVPGIIISDLSDRALAREARELGAEFVIRPVQPAALLSMVRHRLAGAAPSSGPETRMWARRPVQHRILALVEAMSARVIDVSYGGLRFEVDSSSSAFAGQSLRMTFQGVPLAVDVDVIWKGSTGDGRWVYGAEVHSQNRDRWGEFLNSIS